MSYSHGEEVKAYQGTKCIRTIYTVACLWACSFANQCLLRARPRPMMTCCCAHGNCPVHDGIPCLGFAYHNFPHNDKYPNTSCSFSKWTLSSWGCQLQLGWDILIWLIWKCSQKDFPMLKMSCWSKGKAWWWPWRIVCTTLSSGQVLVMNFCVFSPLFVLPSWYILILFGSLAIQGSKSSTWSTIGYMFGGEIDIVDTVPLPHWEAVVQTYQCCIQAEGVAGWGLSKKWL